jgi:hypothetical protein
VDLWIATATQGYAAGIELYAPLIELEYLNIFDMKMPADGVVHLDPLQVGSESTHRVAGPTRAAWLHNLTILSLKLTTLSWKLTFLSTRYQHSYNNHRTFCMGSV